jgi:hypothetical protein
MLTIVQAITYKPGWYVELHVTRDARPPYIQISVANAICASTGVPAPWKSGKRYLSQHMCRQEIVGAVFALIKDAEMHEVHEWFRYRDASIFNPHLDPDVLAEVARKASSFNVRQNAMSMEELV